MTQREHELMTRLVDLLADEVVSRRWVLARVAQVKAGDLDEAERRIKIAEAYNDAA